MFILHRSDLNEPFYLQSLIPPSYFSDSYLCYYPIYPWYF